MVNLNIDKHLLHALIQLHIIEKQSKQKPKGVITTTNTAPIIEVTGGGAILTIIVKVALDTKTYPI